MSAHHPPFQAHGTDGLHPPVELPSWLQHGLAEAAHQLPAQGPIGVFVHHNTLHALQDQPFAQAVEHAAATWQTKPWLDLDRLRDAWRKGELRLSGLATAVDDEIATRAHHGMVPLVDAAVRPFGLAPRELAIATALLDSTPPAGLEWLLRSGATRLPHPDLPPQLARPDALPAAALWHACADRVERGPIATQAQTPQGPALLPRHSHPSWSDALAESVEALIIRYAAAYLDQGAAWWPMPDRHAGLWHATLRLWSQPGLAFAPALAGLGERAANLLHAGTPPATALAAILQNWQVPDERRAEAVVALARILPGWAGMFAALAKSPQAARRGGAANLLDYLALLALVEATAVSSFGARAVATPVDPPQPVAGNLALTWRLWSFVQAASCLQPILAEQIAALPDDQWLALQAHWQRWRQRDTQRLLHLGMEATHRDVWLAALHAHRKAGGGREPAKPRFAVLACFDEREESFRRHLEDASAEIVTHGVPGFFGIPMAFAPLGSSEPHPLCPVAVTPRHLVREIAAQEQAAAGPHWTDRTTARVRRHARTTLAGAALAAVGGAVAAAPLALRILSPATAARLARYGSALLRPQPATRLLGEGTGAVDAHTGLLLGFTARERAERVAAVLQNAGLVRDLPPLVLALGHGATSVNNPHLSAYQCGACGGHSGHHNARLFAQWGNDPAVRALLPELGVALTQATHFIGALHDTTTDDVTAYDLEQLPQTHQADWQDLRAALAKAEAHNAHERCRRFGTAPARLSPALARVHVRARAEDWAEARPEYGHSSNAVAYIGRRRWTRQLFLDRRAFVISYDPTSDPSFAILERILAAAGPVGAGINLEYWFSTTDNDGYGSGTKLPHNVVSLLGVMDGHASDLRTGLTRQMVEIHQPVRLLLVVEATEAALQTVASRQAEVAQLVGNGWVQLVACDPQTGALSRWVAGGFVPWQPAAQRALPQVAQWSQWYGSGGSGHLGPCQQVPRTTTAEAQS